MEAPSRNMEAANDFKDSFFPCPRANLGFREEHLGHDFVEYLKP